jgi:CBS domain containing-hemolysin-like protein
VAVGSKDFQPDASVRCQVLLELGVILVLTLANAFFAGAKIAIASIRKSGLLELL